MFPLVLGLAAAVAKADRPLSVSPDGRFAIRFVADAKNGSYFRVFNRKTKRRIARIADESGGAFSALSKFVWAPDSNRVALNFQSGIRYATTNVYQFQKGTFTELKDLEEGIGDSVIETEKIRLRKEGGFPPESSERRVFDRWFVERWTDPSTAILLVQSIRAVGIPEKGREMTDLTVWVRHTVKFDDEGVWKVAKSEVLSNKEAAALAAREGTVRSPRRLVENELDISQP